MNPIRLWAQSSKHALNFPQCWSLLAVAHFTNIQCSSSNNQQPFLLLLDKDEEMKKREAYHLAWYNFGKIIQNHVQV